MKKKEVKEVSEEEFSNEDGEGHEEEANSGDDWTPNNETGGGGRRGRPRRSTAGKKRQHSDEEEEEEEEEEEDEEDEEDESESESERKPKKKRHSRKEEEDEEEEDEEDEEDDSDDNFNDGVPAKDFTSGAFVVAKSDVANNKDPVLWRIDGKALLQKYLPFEEEGKILYKSTSTYSGWSVNNKDKYYAAKISFKVQSKQETIVELNLEETKSGKQETEVKDEKEE